MNRFIAFTPELLNLRFSNSTNEFNILFNEAKSSAVKYSKMFEDMCALYAVQDSVNRNSKVEFMEYLDSMMKGDAC